MPKKKYQVIKATTREIPGVYVGGKERRFGKNGTFTVSDKGEADEINKVLGAKGKGDVVVVANTEKEPGHKYTFSGIDLPRKNVIGKLKVIGGIAYRYIMKDGKLKLSPLPQKRNKRRTGAEVHDGIDT